MITLYHAQNSRSMRTLWLLEELSIPYQLKEFDFKALIQKQHHSESYLKLHPQGLVPLIIDEDLTLFESGAISLYLCQHYDHNNLLSPNIIDKKPYALFCQWHFWACCTFEAPIWSVVKHSFLLPKEKRNRNTLKSAQKKYNEALAVLEKELEQRDYILSDRFSAADIIIVATIMWYPKPVKNYPKVQAYLERCQLRPAFQRVFKR